MTTIISDSEGSGTGDVPRTYLSFERLPGEKTEAEAWEDSTLFCAENDLPCPSMLSRQLVYIYRNPLDGYGPEHRDSRPIDDATLRQCKQKFDEARDKLREMASLLNHKARLVIPHIVDSDDPWRATLIIRAVVDLMSFGQTREEPLSTPSVFLRDWVDGFGRYLLFATGTSPVFFDKDGEPTRQRRMVAELLSIAGWSYDPAEVDLVCKAVQRDLSGKKPGSTGLRVSREERAEAKAWREAHACA